MYKEQSFINNSATLQDCCNDDELDPNDPEQEFNILLPTDFLEAEIVVPKMTEKECDCFMKKYNKNVKDEVSFILEDKMAMECACTKSSGYNLALVLGLDREEAVFLANNSSFFNEVCQFINENSYQDNALYFAKEAIKASKKGAKIYFPKRIIDKINSKYTCAKKLIKLLPNLKNDIASILKETFDDKAKVDIVFLDKDSLGNIDGFTEIKTTTLIEITLNSQILEKATEEYILTTMYHEVIHAFLNIQKSKLGNVEFEKKYPNIYIHNTLGIYNGKAYSKTQFLIHSPINKGDHFKFERYINMLTESILSYNPKIPRETAQSMAKVGIIRPQELFDWEIQLNQNEREANQFSQGKKCQNNEK